MKIGGRSATLLKALTALSFLEGMVAIVLLIFNPFLGKGVLHRSVSRAQLALILITLLGTICLGWLSYRLLAGKGWPGNILVRLRASLPVHPSIPAWVLIFLLCFILGVAIFLLFVTHLSVRLQDFLFPYPPVYLRSVDILRAIFLRLWPLLAWATMFSLQAALYLLLSRPAAMAEACKTGFYGRVALLLAIAAGALFQWLVLILQLKVFLVIQNWKWYFNTPEVPPNPWIIFALFFLILAAASLVLWRTKQHAWKIIVLVLAGYCIQVGFGFLGGGGYALLQKKFTGSIFAGYARAASEHPPILAALQEYEQRYGSDGYLGTKPPGLLLVYLLTERASSFFNNPATPEGRFQQMTFFMAVVFPFISFLVLPLLYRLARRLGMLPEEAVIPPLLYLVCPNVILIPIFLDQVLYPFLFLLVLTSIHRQIEAPRLPAALLAGFGCTVAAYFSFSLLPLLPLACLWILVDHFLTSPRPGVKQVLKSMAGLFLGALITTALLYWLLNYDIRLRYVNALANHSTTHTFASWGEQVRNAFALNNAEMATWVGFPVILLLLINLVVVLKDVLGHKANRFHALVISTWITYLAILIFGRTNGETQRLYLFLVPLWVLFAGQGTIRAFGHRKFPVFLVVILQFTTMLLTFFFQDFYA